MRIAGLQKMTLLDYPGKVACTVFLQGCNFRCPFCHNSGLLEGNPPDLMTQEEFLSFLKRRQGLLDAVCVSGGEPTLQPDLEALLSQIKALGFLVKLDTNGSRPEILKAMVSKGLVDYVAMDVKNSPDCYGETVGSKHDFLPKIEESLIFLLEQHVPYELRTTVVAELHSEASIAAMGQWLSTLVPDRKPERFFLQPFADRDSVLLPGLSTPSSEQLDKYLRILRPYVEEIALRG